MINSTRGVALLMIPLLAGLGLLVLAWSLVVGPSPRPLPPPAVATQPPLPNPPTRATPLPPAITIAAQPYQHPSQTFSINYPEGWQMDESEDSVQFTAPDEAAAHFSVTFGVRVAASPTDYELDLRQRWGDLENFSMQNSINDHLPDHWAATFTFTQTLAPNQTVTQMQSLSIYWLRDTIRYNFVAVAPAEQWAQLASVVQGLANSLQTFPNLIETE